MEIHHRHKKKKQKRWMQKVVKSIEKRGTKGALRKTALTAGAITKKGTISIKWLKEMAKRGDTVGRRERLALAFRKMRKK